MYTYPKILLFMTCVESSMFFFQPNFEQCFLFIFLMLFLLLSCSCFFKSYFFKTLQTLDLFGNMLVGNIPTEFGLLVNMQVCIHTYIHIYIHTHIHTHTYTYTQFIAYIHISISTSIHV